MRPERDAVSGAAAGEMLAACSRRELLERHGRLYGERRLAVAFTECVPGGVGDPKAVTTKGWHQTRPLADASYAAGLLGKRGLTRNPAIVLRPSNLIGIDVDGEDDLARVEALELPETVAVRSSTPHKRHLYFRPPAELETIPYVAFRFEHGKLSCDTGRYFVAPPALHPSGAVYEFLPGHAPDEIDFAEFPLATYRQLTATAKRESAEQRDRLRAAPDAKVQEGNRREAVFRYACMQRRWTASRELIVDACMRWNETHCEPPLTLEQVAGQVDGAMKKDGEQELAAAATVRPGDERLAEVAHATGEVALQDVLQAVRRYMEISAEEAVYLAVALATAAARDLADEEPLWLMLVGASGSGKTEAIRLCALAADGRVDELTRAGLLSWTPGKKPRRTGPADAGAGDRVRHHQRLQHRRHDGRPGGACPHVRGAARHLRRSHLPLDRRAAGRRRRNARMGRAPDAARRRHPRRRPALRLRGRARGTLAAVPHPGGERRASPPSAPATPSTAATFRRTASTRKSWRPRSSTVPAGGYRCTSQRRVEGHARQRRLLLRARAYRRPVRRHRPLPRPDRLPDAGGADAARGAAAPARPLPRRARRSRTGAVQVAVRAAFDSIPLGRLKALQHVAGEEFATVASTLRGDRPRQPLGGEVGADRARGDRPRRRRRPGRGRRSDRDPALPFGRPI